MTTPKDIATRVASRHLAESQLDEKTKVLLLKLRKGADASLTMSGLIKVLTQILGGWKVDKIVGLSAQHGSEMFGHGKDDMKNLLAEDNEEVARRKYEKLEAEVVATLPTKPVIGRWYVQDLEPFSSWKSYGDHQTHGAKFRAWVGVEGLRFTSPEGKTFEVLLRQRSHSSRVLTLKDLRPYEVLPWIKKETSYYARINDLLGMEEHIPAPMRTRDGTGTCAACFRNIKIGRGGLMALHGYERPGHGYINGRCVGGNHEPYELSPEGTQLMLQGTENMLTKAKKDLATLKAGPANIVTTNWRKEEVTYLKGSPEYTRELESRTVQTERLVSSLERDVKIYSFLISDWEKRELPAEGSHLVDYYTRAARKVGH